MTSCDAYSRDLRRTHMERNIRCAPQASTWTHCGHALSARPPHGTPCAPCITPFSCTPGGLTHTLPGSPCDPYLQSPVPPLICPISMETPWEFASIPASFSPRLFGNLFRTPTCLAVLLNRAYQSDKTCPNSTVFFLTTGFYIKPDRNI